MDSEWLTQLLSEREQPAYRAQQIWEWLSRGVTDYEQMTNLPGDLRSVLAEELPFSTLTLLEESESDDGTNKALFRTHDGHSVEAVFLVVT